MGKRGSGIECDNLAEVVEMLRRWVHEPQYIFTPISSATDEARIIINYHKVCFVHRG